MGTPLVVQRDGEFQNDFALVSYRAPSGSWSDAETPEQVSWNAGVEGEVDGVTVCFGVDVPPVE